MAFSDYKHIYQVQTDYQIEYQEDNFLIIAEYNPSNQIIAELEFNQKNIDIFSSTDGKLWEFGKLVDKIFSKNSDSFILNELSKLFGALKFIFDEVTKEIV